MGIYQRLFAIPKELYLFHDIPVIHRETHENSEVSEEDTDEVEQDKNRFALRLDNLWPIVYLTGLRVLSLFGFYAEKAAVRLGDSTRPSYVKSLSLIGNQVSSFTFPDIQAVIARPESLDTSHSTYG